MYICYKPAHPLQYESFANIYSTSNKKLELIIKHVYYVGVFDLDFKMRLGMKLLESLSGKLKKYCFQVTIYDWSVVC